MKSIKKNNSDKKLIVVHSIKGGCGKTTISLGLAQYFGNKLDHQSVCYIDTDIVGPGTIALSDETNDINDLSFSRFVLLNPFDDPEYFKTQFENNPIEKFERFLSSPASQELCQHFRAVFASSDRRLTEKAISATSDLFFAEDVKFKLEVLIKRLFDNNIDTIILDTTPGEQGITKIVLEIAKSIAHQKKAHFVQLMISTLNFAHLKGLLGYLEHALDKEKKNHHELLIINQIPLTVELIKAPDLEIAKDELDNISPNDDRVKEFQTCLKRSGEGINSDAIFNAFKTYFRIRDKNFFPSRFSVKKELSKKGEKKIKGILKNTLIVPERGQIRHRSTDISDEDCFDKVKFFELLENEAQQGHIKLVGKHIEEITKLAHEQH